MSPLNWTIVECSLGIICVSIPPMRPLFNKLAPGFLGSRGTRHGSLITSRGMGKIPEEGSSQSQLRSPHDVKMFLEADDRGAEFEMSTHSRVGSNTISESPWVGQGGSSKRSSQSPV